MNVAHAAIRLLEIEIEAIYQGVAEKERFASSMRQQCGLGPDDELDVDDSRLHEMFPAASKRAPAGRRSARKVKRRGRMSKRAPRAAKRTNERTNERATRVPHQRAVRSLPDHDGITTRILEALHKKSPRSPAELTAAAKADKLVVRRLVKQLAVEGKVTLTGATLSRQVHLGKLAAAAAQSPKPKAQSPKPDTQRSNDAGTRVAQPRGNGAAAVLDQVEVLDEALLANLKVAGRTGRSLKELQISRPEETPDAIERALTRLRIKKRIAVDDGGRWTAII